MTIENLVVDLVDQYKVEQLIAVKRYTDHYLAYDVDEDHNVTLDVLRATEAPPGFAAQFTNRARAIAQIRHPNIARIKTVGHTETDQPYVAQTAIDGYSLAQRLEQLSARPGSVNTIYALKLVRQLADALLLATRLNLLHYDLRPPNVLLKNVALASDDVLILTDLFVPYERRNWNADAEPSELIAYLSPEQRDGKDIDTTSHVYSLGVLIFQLLAAAPPSGPTQGHDALLRRLSSGGTSLESLHPGLTAETYELVDHSLRKDPRQRYESIDAFILALEQALLAEELQVGAATYPTATAARRPWGILAVLVIAALGTVAALTGAQLMGDQSANTSTSAELVQDGIDLAEPGAVSETRIDSAGNGSGNDPAVEVAASATAEQGVVAPLPSPTTTPTVLASRTQLPTVTPSASATARATSTDAPPTPTIQPRVEVSLNSVNLRRGPGTNYAQIGALMQGDELVVVARVGEGDNTWFEVRADDDLVGWLSASVVRLVGDLDAELIPTAASIPSTPTSTSTPTPTPAPVPLATETPFAGAGDDGGGGSGNPPAPTQPPVEPSRTPPPLDP